MSRIVYRIRPGTRLAPDGPDRYRIDLPVGGTVRLNPPAVVPLLMVDGRRSAEEIERTLARTQSRLPHSEIGPLLQKMAVAGMLEEAETTWLPLESRPWPAHRCQGCGGSCQGHWVGPLDPDFITRTTERMPALRQRYPHLADVKPFVRIDPEDTALYLNASSGQCCFLDEQMRCILHKEYGPSEKPTICSMFPHVRFEDGSVTRIGLGLMCLKHFDQVLQDDPDAPAGHWEQVHEELDGRLFHFYPSEQARSLEEEILARLRGASDPLGVVLERVAPRRSGLGRVHVGRRLEHLSLRHLERMEADLAAEPVIVALSQRSGLLPERLNAIRALGRPDGSDVSPRGLRLPSAAPGRTGPRTRVLADALLRFHFLRHYLMFHTIPHAVAGFALGVWVALVVTPPAGEGADSRFGESLATWMRIIQSPTVRRTLFASPAEVDDYLEVFERFWKAG